MKYLFNFLMMFIAYNAFAQSGKNEKIKNIVTFPNGDEAITIIENSERNVIQLITTDDYNRYEMLDLSNHEAAHRATKKRGLMSGDAKDQFGGNYMVGKNEREPTVESENEEEETSGA